MIIGDVSLQVCWGTRKWGEELKILDTTCHALGSENGKERVYVNWE